VTRSGAIAIGPHHDHPGQRAGGARRPVWSADDVEGGAMVNATNIEQFG
jgi:hypothetical protein